MAQIADAVSSRLASLEYSLNGTSWVDMSGATQSVDSAEFARMLSDGYTLDGPKAFITAGKLEPADMTFNVYYNEGSSAPFTVLWTAHMASNLVHFRFSPYGGNTTGEDIYTTPAVNIRSMTTPGLDAASSDPLLFSVTIRTPGIDKSDAT